MNLLVDDLRKLHPKFIYHSYKYFLEKDSLKISFHFEIFPNINFYPTLKISGLNLKIYQTIPKQVIKNFIFNLGMIEVVSYWKATCSPEIIINAGSLNMEQISWWKELYLKGMGEFFYRNKIDFTALDFVKLTATNKSNNDLKMFNSMLDEDSYLIPIGGGKDSIVTLELLVKSKKKIIPFCLNASEASKHITKMNNLKSSVQATRIIDRKLLELNNNGYLNGHTPFTAYTSFLSSFCAVLFGSKFVLLSNERSSNEGNTFYKEFEINHQYSKSFEFENKFRIYSKKYLVENLEYLSFLRPLYELQIAKIFKNFPKYFSIFRSCNKNQKLNSWCHSCSKCLFAYLIIYPFVDKQILTTEIFSEDLFEKKELLSIAESFLRKSAVKPFDCVGTREETRLAFYLCLEKSRSKGVLPFLLRELDEKKLIALEDVEKSKKEILKGWDEQNFLPKDLENILRESLNK